MFGFSSTTLIGIRLNEHEVRPKVPIRVESGEIEDLVLVSGDDDIEGEVHINSSKKIKHKGITIELVGRVGMSTQSSRSSHDTENLLERTTPYEFLSMTKELAPAGEMNKKAVFEFNFSSVKKPYETYFGTNVRLRYVK